MAMGTMLSDTMSDAGGLAHAAPPLHHLREQHFARRWQEWLPWATIESRKHSDPASQLYILKQRHRSRLLALLDARIGWPAIERNRLDSPVMDDAAFEFQLRCAKARRDCRMGRVKGKGKKYAKQP
jgi:hypothetical protein